jgi:hypothetical protein
MMTLENAYAELKDAKAKKKIASDALKDAKAANSTLADLAQKKKDAAIDYKAELDQFEANHAPLVEAVEEAKQTVKDAQLQFNETTEVALGRGEQLSFLTPEGEVTIAITAKATLEPMVGTANQAEIDAEIAAGVADVEAGQVRQLS